MSGSSWRSFKDLGSLKEFGSLVSQTIQTAERAIDKAIGIPEESGEGAVSAPNKSPEINNSTISNGSTVALNTSSTPTNVTKEWDQWPTEEWRNSNSPKKGTSPKTPLKSESQTKSLPTTPITSQHSMSSRKSVEDLNLEELLNGDITPVAASTPSKPSTTQQKEERTTDDSLSQTQPTEIAESKEVPEFQTNITQSEETKELESLPPLQATSESSNDTPHINDTSKEDVKIDSSQVAPETPMEERTISEDEANITNMSFSTQEAAELERKMQLLEQTIKDRERQLQVIIRDNATLREDNEQLKSKLDVYMVSGDGSIDSLKSEFSKRLGDLERKLNSIKKERDDLKKNGSNLINEQLISEKDNEISGLRMEGEKLAKKHLQFESTIKSLRQKNKEQESTINNLKERLQNTENLLETKVGRLKEVEEENRRYSDMISTMKDVSDTSAKQLEDRKKAADGLSTKVAELEAALKKAWVEIADQKKAHSATVARAETQLKESEAKIREEYQIILVRQSKESAERETQLAQTIQELRSAMSSTSERANWKEDEYQAEIQSLKLRLQHAEQRNQELFASVPETTRPLLRQIEQLQQTITDRALVWEELERNLLNRLNEAELRAQTAADKEREAEERLNEMRLKVKSLESDISANRSAVARLNAELEFERSKLEERQKEIDNLQAQLTTNSLHYEKTLQEARQTELKLQRALSEAEEREDLLRREKAEIERRKSMEFDKVSPSSSFSSIPPSPTPMHRVPSYSSLLGQSLVTGVSNSTALPLEKIQALLRQKDGEILALQEQIASLDKTRNILQDELVNQTTVNENLSKEVEEIASLRAQIKEKTQRYDAALILIGEKEEMVEELKADILDVKSLYRTQISELLEQIEQLKKQVKK